MSDDQMIIPHAVKFAMETRPSERAEEANRILGTTSSWEESLAAFSRLEDDTSADEGDGGNLDLAALHAHRRHLDAVIAAEARLNWFMHPKDFIEAREELGLERPQFGRMLGYKGNQIEFQIKEMEHGKKPIREPQRRLIEAYLAGYRPPDWPIESEIKAFDDLMQGGEQDG